MSWNKLPVTSSVGPAAQHMDELREAMEERDGVGQLHYTGRSTAASVVGALTDVAFGDYGRFLEEYRRYFVELVDLSNARYCFARGQADDFATLTLGADAAGLKNIYDAALGGGASDWTKALTDPGNKLHPNEMRLALNEIECLKTAPNLGMSDCGWTVSGDEISYDFDLSDYPAAIAPGQAWVAVFRFANDPDPDDAVSVLVEGTAVGSVTSGAAAHMTDVYDGYGDLGDIWLWDCTAALPALPGSPTVTIDGLADTVPCDWRAFLILRPGFAYHA